MKYLFKKQTFSYSPDQTPVMTVDQPLYALGKQIQWTKSGDIDDKHFLVMMGDLHVEMTFMKCLG